MNINQRAHNCDVAIASGDEGELQKLSSELEIFLEGEVSREQECAVHYLLGNLNAALSRINNENATSWRDEKWSKYTALTINHFREANLMSENEGS